MDNFITAFGELCNQLLPILRATALVVLIIFIIKLIKAVSSLDATLLKSHTTIDLVDQSLEKAQVPLDTVVKVSNTVDKAHDATVEAVETTKDFIVKNAGNIKEKVTDLISGNKKTEKIEVDPEDIIGE